MGSRKCVALAILSELDNFSYREAMGKLVKLDKTGCFTALGAIGDTVGAGPASR
jgi:hypothetical protein